MTPSERADFVLKMNPRLKMTDQEKAFLSMLAWSEGTITIPGSDNGYDVLVGATEDHPKLFHSYSTHPGILNSDLNSTAAGRYQILKRFFLAYKTQLSLPDFGPSSQDKIALQMIKECHAVDAINSGDICTAIRLCASRWASLPGAGYKQHEHKESDLVASFIRAGGKVNYGVA